MGLCILHLGVQPSRLDRSRRTSFSCIRPHVLREVKVVLHQASVGMQRGVSTRLYTPLTHGEIGLTYLLPHPENHLRRHTLSIPSRVGGLQVVPETRQRAGDEAAWSTQCHWGLCSHGSAQCTNRASRLRSLSRPLETLQGAGPEPVAVLCAVPRPDGARPGRSCRERNEMSPA